MENKMNDLKPSIDQIIELIAALSNSMRQLSLSALDLQALALSKKHQIEKKIDMVDDLGDTIDELIRFLMRLIPCYIAQYDSREDHPYTPS
ncbi:MAG TPA: hypothetical protein DDW50_19910 [Firmicutes bacterium]|nr:hypothetical protein [Bacillota bacterium]